MFTIVLLLTTPFAGPMRLPPFVPEAGPVAHSAMIDGDGSADLIS